MKSARFALFLLGPALVLAAWGCAAGPGPDLNGPQGPSLMAAYSGDWVLSRPESDDIAAMMRGGAPTSIQAPTAGAGDITGGGGGGGGRGGRRGGGGAIGGGAAPDPAQLRRAMEALRVLVQPPAQITLDLEPGTVSVTEAGPGAQPMLLPLDADQGEPLVQGTVHFTAHAKWTSKGLEIQRKPEGGGGVTDDMSVDANGRLIVKRKIQNPSAGTVSGTLVYTRAGSGS